MLRLALCPVLALLLTCSVWAQPESRAFLQVWDLVREHFYDPNLSDLDLEEVKAEYLPLLAEKPESFVELINLSLAKLNASHTEFLTDNDPRYFELLDVFCYGPSAQAIRRRFGGQLPHYSGILARYDGPRVTALVPGGAAAQRKNHPP